MCGILFQVQSPSGESQQDTWSTLEKLNARRGHLTQLCNSSHDLGPSAQDTYRTTIPQHDTQDIELSFYGAVLHLRGDIVIRQPHVSQACGNVLIWNGEIFDGITVNVHQNDGQVLMDQLETVSFQSTSGQVHLNLFLKTMVKIEGPYAFVYFHASRIEGS
ncbi:hypothetical protein BGZ65_012792 [Modicella reniformis]|uniref:Uncharacterized protein n=1 Tax=Modicella reniformis TaxID=1440133 RepID=A0A9P6MAE0_9FUNG|nr:hypothetical protein BGZ65_012792 [Modicella reniformis]